MPSYWFGDVDDSSCQPFSGDARHRAERVLSLCTSMDDFVPPDWQMAADCGVCSDRGDYIAQLRQVCFFIAEQKIRKKYAGRDTELYQMVKSLDELDRVINLLSERAGEWYQTKRPDLSRKYHRVSAAALVRKIGRYSGGAILRMTGDILRLSSTRTALAKEISARAVEVMPNTSALIGGLVAARLLMHAGGLAELAKMPASTIQVLGARTALFSHLRSRTPAPKHGIIFQHRRVHNAGKQVRGRVARVLAAKLAIAARLDLYRGAAVPGFIEKAQARINAAGESP
jgi:nucleolar protein 56